MPAINIDDAINISSRVAEANVAGSVLREPDVIDDVSRLLTPDDFVHLLYRSVFEAAVDLRRAGQPVEAAAAFLWLKANRPHDGFTVAQIAEVLEEAPTAASALFYAKQVGSLALRRRLVAGAARLILRTYESSDLGEMCEAVGAMASDAETRILGTADPVPLSVAVAEALGEIDERRRLQGGRSVGIQTGFADIDMLVPGMRPGQMIVIGARPGLGKTAIAANILLNAAHAGHNSLFVCLEMSQREIAERAIAIAGDIPMHRMARGQITESDSGAILKTAQRLRDTPGTIYLIDDPRMSPAGFAAAVRSAVRRQGVRLVCLDYLQLLQPQNTRWSRTEQVGYASRTMKLVARECGVPVLVLAQLNREVEDRPDQRPWLSDLKNSGDVEQDADIVMLLHVDPKVREEHKEEPVLPTDVILAKQRNGPSGTASLSYLKAQLRYSDYCPSAD